jgi:hypothetical protein
LPTLVWASILSSKIVSVRCGITANQISDSVLSLHFGGLSVGNVCSAARE